MTENIDYKIVDKSKSSFMKFLGTLLFFNKSFMTDYVTTIGRTIYVPSGDISPITLKHELVHVADYNKYGILFSLSYLLCLPTIFTMRSFWEKRAYKVTIEETYKESSRYAKSEGFKERIVGHFIGPDYLYMNPFKSSVEKWFDQVLSEVENAA